jgi:hypothetical protein
MKIFYILLTAMIVSFSGCTGASEENADNPTITLKGDRDITLKVGQQINEPGYTANDPQDGDLTKYVQVKSDLDFNTPGQYYVNYSVKDRDGNVANASRTVTITNTNTSGGDGIGPIISLAGSKNITLKVGQQINEPGYTANDPQDGDLTNKVQVTSNLDYYHEGQYYVNYSVTDSDGYTANASRVITITQNGATDGQYGGDYHYGDANYAYYDLATYNYNYLVHENGKVVTQTMLNYDQSGNTTETKVVFDKNKNDGSIYEYNDNVIKSRDYIQIDKILTVNGFNQNSMKRNIRVGEVFAQASENGVNLNCELVEHLGNINTSDLTQATIQGFDYIDALHIRCTSNTGVTTDTYLVNGWGEVLSIINDNGNITYKVLDKNSMREK